MRILFDHGTPRGLARQLVGHQVTIAKSMGWARLSNGNLLSAAERAGFDLLLTTDQGIRYQQNLSARKISLLVLTGSIKWTQVRLYVERVSVALSEVAPGSYAESSYRLKHARRGRLQTRERVIAPKLERDYYLPLDG